MMPSFVAEKVRRTVQKNTATSYGLSLVVGLPFPDEICARIGRIQQQLEALAPGRFTWYGPVHLHATLFAPLRGRYREWPPLQWQELPADLEGLARDVASFFVQLDPFSLELAGVHVSQDGVAEVRENTLVQRLVSTLRRHPELDEPKHRTGLHVAIGFLNKVPPFDTDEEQARFEAGLDQFMYTPVGQVTVQQVWLVHYANRTLDRIVGKVPLALGRVNTLTAEQLLRELGIASRVYSTGQSDQ
jgi:hypothetical protein